MASLLHLVEEDTVVVLRDMCRLVTTGANQDNAAHRLRMYVPILLYLASIFCVLLCCLFMMM